MSKTSSDNAAESKSSPPECAENDLNHESGYYYDDATGYETYREDEEDDDESEPLQNRAR